MCVATLLLIGHVMGQSTSPEEAYRHLAVYTEVLSRIKSDYVEEPDIKSVTLGALNGLLESVDPFASYLSPEQYKQYLKSREGRKAGVGLLLSKKYGYLGVVDAIPGSAADKAGIATGDVIESIAGVSTRDMPLAYAEMLLEGDAGSSVELAVLRVRRSSEAQKVALVRALVKAPGLQSKMLPDQIGYIEVGGFAAGRSKEVAKAVEDLQKQGAKRLILDLRHSASGPIDEGIALAGLFVDKGLLTYLQGQKVARQNFNADPSKAITKLPLVVITNRGTAGAAEVAAGALLENKRAEVVGERTYGDAAQRRAIVLDDGAAVILSVAKYYSPGGKAIQDTGVTPSVPYAEPDAAPELDDENQPQQQEPQPQQQPQPPPKPEEDLLLKKAIEVALKGAVIAQAGL